MGFKLDKALLKEPDFNIIANNCWGAEVYKTFDLPFNTPIIGLYFYADCYIKLIGDFQENIRAELKFKPLSKYYSEKREYPVGLLKDDIEVHFLHYESEEEAYEKWTRRVKRISQDNEKLFFKFDDRDRCAPEHIRTFHDLRHTHKVSFTAKNYPDIKDNVHIPMKKGEETVMDGLKLFYECVNYFDLVKWLNGEGVNQRFNHKVRKLIATVKGGVT